MRPIHTTHKMGAPGLVMGPCIVEIDHIVIREVQYQLEVNWCRNEEIIVKGKFGWAWPMWAECPRIDHIVIREVQYQFEVNWFRNEEIKRGAQGLVMGPCIVEIDCIVIKEVQYQFEVNHCKNEEIIVKGNFRWAWPLWTGRPRINRIVIREVQYQFEVIRCRNEEIIVNGNFGWVWPMWAWRPRIDRIVIRKVLHQFEVNRKTAILGGRGLCGRGAPGLVMGPCIVEIDSIVIREVQYQFEVNWCRNEEFQGSSAYRRTDKQTDRRAAEITTISPRFSKSAQNIIGTNLLTKFHEHQKINVASRVITRKNAPPPGSHVFQPTGIIFDLFQDIIGINLLTKFHEDRTVNVASRVLTRFYYSHIRKNAPPHGSHFFQANIIIFKLIKDIIETNLLTKCHEDWPLESTKTIFKFIQDIIGTNLLTKFHDDRKINVTYRPRPRGGHVFQPTGIIFELVQDITGMNLLTEFHEDRTINVASRVKNAPPLGGHVFQANVTIFELIQDIIETNLLTKFHEDWTINVDSRELTRQMLTPHNGQRTKTKNAMNKYLTRVKNAPPPGGHVFQLTQTIFKLVQDIIRMNLLTKFHEDRTINVASRVLTRKNAPPPDILGTNLMTKFHDDRTINVASIGC
ncbi:hypothetical protein DPMN_116547 [Dreissena polymorpha]|uniref:Uncharacterized protein n=1 Tax=Dreissena polymorpha TaxID=45954 RepID=A0A9D4KNW1_DREPO|nr:hypothetical protein DPMN_116547 [Dreissena polymorpha]